MDSNFWKNKKVLLTGHTGFKGSWLSLWLQKLDVDLIGYSKSVPTKPSLFEVANVEEKMTSIMGDVIDLQHVTDVIEKYNPDIIIHMAAQSLVGKSFAKPVETFQTNVMGTVNLFEAIRTLGKKCVLINVTSDKCYQNQELARGYKESDPMGGYDPYSCSKGCAELITSSFRNSFFNQMENQSNNVAIASVRAGNVIGGGDWAEDRLIPDIIRGVSENRVIKIRNPNAVRPWQYVLEPLRGYLMLAQKLWEFEAEYAEGWNFGPKVSDAKPVSWILEKFEKSLGIKINYELSMEESKPETLSLKLDCSKAESRLSWHPKTDIELGLNLTADWHKQYEEKSNMREFTEKQIEYFESL